jgi:hypothetical protein
MSCNINGREGESERSRKDGGEAFKHGWSDEREREREEGKEKAV